MLTTVPFAGFYSSVHDEELDHAFDMLFQNEDGDRNDKLNERVFDMIDWQKVQLAYAEDYVENFAHEFEVKITWESMVSPREYNFGTDRLFAHISRAEVRRLRKSVVNEAPFREQCRENFTSRSGFLSSYSNDPDDWGSIDKWDHNQVGTLLQALANQECGSDDGFDCWAEFALMESSRGNGMLDDWLWSAVKPSEEWEQIKRVYSYLRDREQRKWVTRRANDLTTIERRA